jgi:hypothetical protein
MTKSGATIQLVSGHRFKPECPPSAVGTATDCGPNFARSADCAPAVTRGPQPCMPTGAFSSACTPEAL